MLQNGNWHGVAEHVISKPAGSPDAGFELNAAARILVQVAAVIAEGLEDYKNHSDLF